jgi:DNA-binding response OmpR family regulator
VADLAGKSILVAEHDPNIAYVIKLALELEGCTVQTVATVAAAIRSIEQFQPDLVVLDHKLPDGNCDAVVTAYRQRCANAPVVVMSGQPEARLRVLAKKLQYLSKPFDMDTLVSVVHTAFG